MTATKAPTLPADLEAGLKRLKLAQIRSIAPELLQTAKTQRWAPEELLRTLVEAEIAAGDASNARARLRAAGFPVAKTLDEFNLKLSSIPQATFDYLASLEWIAAAENLCPDRPDGCATPGSPETGDRSRSGPPTIRPPDLSVRPPLGRGDNGRNPSSPGEQTSYSRHRLQRQGVTPPERPTLNEAVSIRWR